MLRYGLVEARIEIRNIGRTGEFFVYNLHNLERSGIVQWREIGELLEVVVRRYINHLGMKVIPAMHDTVANELYVFLASQIR